MGNINSRLRAATMVFVVLAVTGCVLSGSQDDGGPSAEEPSISTSRLAAAERFDPDEACDLLGIGAVPPLGETYDYEVLEPNPNRTGCSQEVARLGEDDFRIRSVVVMGHGLIWEGDEEAAEFAFRRDVDDPGSYLYSALEPELSEAMSLEGDWDEGIVVTAPDWELYPEFRVEVREGPVLLTYWITLSSNHPRDTECVPEMVEGCVIGFEMVLAWIEDELLPEALANLREAGYVDT